MGISPNSLMITAVRAIAGSRSARFISVVLPLPRNPVRMLTGVRMSDRSGITVVLLSAGSLAMIGEQFRAQGRLAHLVLRRIGGLGAERFGGMPGPTRIIERAASQHDEVGVTAGNQLLGVRGL